MKIMTFNKTNIVNVAHVALKWQICSNIILMLSYFMLLWTIRGLPGQRFSDYIWKYVSHAWSWVTFLQFSIPGDSTFVKKYLSQELSRSRRTDDTIDVLNDWFIAVVVMRMQQVTSSKSHSTECEASAVKTQPGILRPAFPECIKKSCKLCAAAI